ncbi:MAG: flavodoxin family protein [Bacteroidaceae bacterium]|nr:flavodoxin family protein [Bacteroidaceae bacterium]
MSKVLIINGSPKARGNTALALQEVRRALESQGIETEWMHVGHHAIRGCIGCGRCRELGKCVFDDDVNEAAAKFQEADGLLIGTLVYYASPAGTLVSFLDRLFFSTPFSKMMKVGAAVAVARRGGLTATYDMLNKYFGISNMPIATSRYWNQVHGQTPGQAVEDQEGMQTMRQLGLNMAFLIKSIALGKEQFGLPTLDEETLWTNFVR